MFSKYVRQYFISRITPHWSEIRDWSYRIEKLEKEIEQLQDKLYDAQKGHIGPWEPSEVSE